MKVALVWPYGSDYTYALPLGIAFLVANCKLPGLEIRVFDGTLHEADAESTPYVSFLREFQPDIVGVSCWSRTYLETLRCLRTVRRVLPACVTLVGGIHPTAYWRKVVAQPEIDYILMGEAESSFPGFLQNFHDLKSRHATPGLVYRSGGGVVANPPVFSDDLDALALPDYQAIDLPAYFRKGYRYFSQTRYNAPIWLTRGCPYHCSFCTAPQINGHRIRKHSVAYGIRWIDMLYRSFGVRHVNIIDDNFTFDMEYAKEFCRQLIAQRYAGLTIYAANGIRAQRTDRELFDLMKQAGWKQVTVAPESGSPRVLALMRKTVEPDFWPDKVREIQRAGLAVHGLFLIGYPGETRDDLVLTARLARQCRFNSLTFQYFQPLPGTPIYDELVAAGEIADVLLPNSTTGARVYVTPALADFNFSLFALRLYLFNFLVHPYGTLHEILSYNPRLIFFRLWNLVLDSVKSIFSKQRMGVRPPAG